MKKITKILICITLLCVMAASLAGCKDNDSNNPPPDDGNEYLIMVENGTGNGFYLENADCTVIADEKDGLFFLNWTAGGIAVSTDSTYTFKVTKDISLVANYTSASAILTVTGGGVIKLSDGEAPVKTASLMKNSSVTVMLEDNQNYKFKYFTVGEDTAQITQNPYNFTITDNTTVNTVIDRICLISVIDGAVKGDKNTFFAGESCTVEPDDAYVGGEFAYWYKISGSGDKEILSRDREYTFTVENSINLYAHHSLTYTVTVTGGDAYIKSEGSPTEKTFVEGDNCTVVAPKTATHGLQSWTIGDTVVSTNSEYTFDVYGDVDIVAVYRELNPFATPVNTWQAFNWYNVQGTPPNQTVGAAEFVRYQPNIFTADVDHILYYVYTDGETDNKNYIARFRMYNANGANDYLRSFDNERYVGYQGGNNNDACIQKGNPGGSVDDFYRFMAYVIPDYSDTANYYFAIQIVANSDSLYTTSEVSDIGAAAYTEKGTKVRVNPS